MPEVDQTKQSHEQAALVTELKRIRKSRGALASASDKLVGPHLVRLCGIDQQDTSEVIRSKLTSTLSRLMANLNKQDTSAVAAAIGLGEEYTEKPLLGDRIERLAKELGVDSRTARRRMDHAFERLVEIALLKPPSADSNNAAKRGWHAQLVRTVVLLSDAGIEVLELRTIVSESLDLRSIYLGFSTHPASEGIESPQKRLQIDALYGGDIVERRIETSARTGFALEFPRALRLGEAYEYGVRFRLPAAAKVRPYYVLVPIVSCDEFDLRVKFQQVPSRVELLSGVFQADTQDSVLDAPAIEINTLGEVHATFRQLQPGMAYGIRWKQ